MTSKDNLVARARTAVVRRLDPVAAKRTATLAERRTNGIEATPEVAAALDATAALAVRDLAQRIRSGDLDAHHQAALAQLVEAYLSEHPAESLPHGVAQAVASSFEGLWQPVGEPVNEPPPYIRDVIRDQFHRLYYHVSKRTWKDTWYRGVRTYKCPTDMWIYMELIDQLEPGLVIETGTYRGGSALYIADRLETIGAGNVVTVDVNEPPNPPQHPRLTYFTGSSTDPTIVEKIAGMIPEGSPVLVILDSDHSRDHVAAELEAYAPARADRLVPHRRGHQRQRPPRRPRLRTGADGGDVGLHGHRPRLRGRRALRAVLPDAEPLGVPQARALTSLAALDVVPGPSGPRWPRHVVSRSTGESEQGVR